MDADLLEKIKNKNVVLIDVRDAVELLLEGEIEDALHIPLGTIPDRLEEIKRIETPMAIFCAKGIRAQKAIDFLDGFINQDLYNAGGYLDVAKVLKKK